MAVETGGRAKLEYGDQGDQTTRTPKKGLTTYSRRSPLVAQADRVLPQ